MKRSLLLLALLFLVSGAHRIASGQISIENRFPVAAPLKVEFKGNDVSDWIHQLEVTVTNTGDKPIYYVYVLLYLNVKDENGIARGFTFNFGNGKKFYSTEAIAATENDPVLLLNDSHTFRIANDTAKAWDLLKRKTSFVSPRSAELSLGWLSFGDGSGFAGGGKAFNRKIY